MEEIDWDEIYDSLQDHCWHKCEMYRCGKCNINDLIEKIQMVKYNAEMEKKSKT